MASTSSPPPSPQPRQDPSPPPSPPIATALPLLTPCSVTAAPPPSSRRLPPPCWTPDETSALIDAYRDKWYSLRRGNLRAAHWQEVADDVHHRCPAASPAKTAVQCRHKMEKLRKRYRSDLQRAKSIPHHRFSSSWAYFSKMDAMEKGPNASPSSVSVSLSSPPVATVVAAATPVDSLNDLDEDDPDEDEDDADEDYAYRNYDPRRDFNREYNRNNGLRIKIQGNSGSASGFRSKKSFGDFDENPNPNPSYGSYNYKPPKYTSINNFSSPPPQFDEGTMRYGTRVAKNGINSNGSASGLMNPNPMMMNQSKKKKVKRSGGVLGKREREREREEEGAMEMVEAIGMLGEGFVRMEKMKMEMMRETERMRMEMEMKRTEMILESQHTIVEAFAKAWGDSIKDASC